MTAKSRHSRGAKRPSERLSWAVYLHWLGRGVSLLVLVVAAGGALWGSEKLFRHLDAPIEIIAVKGQFSYADKTVVQSLVEPLIRGGIISLSLSQIRHQLEQHPWIDQVSVSRQWPNGLVITVAEEVPIARWGDSGFLNNRGEMLEIGDNSSLAHLPLLVGSENSERSLMTAYREVAQLLLPSGLKIAALKRDERGAWWLNLDNGLDVVIGRDQVMEKMRRFIVVWELVLKAQIERIVRVDIRYDNGIAVQWDESAVIKQDANRISEVVPGLLGQV